MSGEADIAAEKFLSGYNCAQAILYTFAPKFGLDPDMALKLATGLGAGMCRRGEVCGAVSGGIVALGLKFGRGAGQERSATEQTYQLAGELMSRFEKRHGSCLCRILLEGCDLRTPEGQARVKEKDMLHNTCLPCVRTVAEEVCALIAK